MYAANKCVDKKKVDGYINFMLEKLGLSHLADRPAGTFSGGNKRKLSLGLALIGSPKILICDEISSGVDPSSRRVLWNLISSTMAHRSVILTTHSMEEAESLSNTITIMASGRLRCYGSSLHLKQRYGKGLQIEIQCKEGGDEAAKNWFKSTFVRGHETVEEYRLTLRYAVPRDQYPMSEVFRIMESGKQSEDTGIDSYSVSETSLDQLFVQFVHEDDMRRIKHKGERS
jgi:ABC-type multidrug transport system ATPase subunit